ncbi:MAG: 16S rRNA (cytidine(1402)-2'-O)-methyltransferase [Kiritimatiellae bacterium]|nr:16S rRNA (cytidine(1402)-2'-O)-methyltransferase [Kiritimatiellia bacterium]
MQPGLYIVGTPIGNLGDITLRALDALREADLVLAEDTRRTGRLLARYEIDCPLLSCHKFNEASRVDGVLQRIRSGAAVALVADSGMPGVSDPGARVVTACRENGLPVTVVPGPSAVPAAIALAGVRGSGYLFEGFLPKKRGARAKKLAELAGQACPVVFFESPYRLLKVLQEMAELLGDRTVYVCREITKIHEECRVGRPAELAAALHNRSIKGEIVVVIAPATH